MLHAGLDLSRKRLDFCLLDGRGERVEVGAVPPDGDGLVGFVRRVGERHGQTVRAAIESMNGARFVHDTLERLGWEVEIADAARVKGLAPLGVQDGPDRRLGAGGAVAAGAGAGDLAAVVSGPSRARTCPLAAVPGAQALLVQASRACAAARVRARLPRRDLFGARGRQLLARLEFPEPWRGTSWPRVHDRRPRPRDQRDRKGASRTGRRPPLHPAADDGPRDRLGARLHDRGRDRRHRTVRVPHQTGRLHRPLPARLPVGPKRPPRPLDPRRPQIPALGADGSRRPRLPPQAYRDRYQRNKHRLGKQRGAKVAQVDIARRLSEAIWQMLTRNQPFAPASATRALAA